MFGKADEQGTIRFGLNINPDTKLPIFDAKEDTGKFVVSILNNREKYLGKKIHMATEYVTFPQIAEALSKATGKKYTFDTVPREVLAKYGVDEEIVSCRFFVRDLP